MIKFVRNMLKRRKARMQDMQWKEGYDAAAGSLLRTWDEAGPEAAVHDVRFKLRSGAHDGVPEDLTAREAGTDAACDAFSIILNRLR